VSITSLPDAGRRTVITGLGVVAPNGIGTAPWWEATLAGTSGIGRISRFDPSRYATRYAGEVRGFEPTDYLERRLIVQTDRWTWMGLAATQMALEDAALDPTAQDPYAMGVVTASSSGGNEFGQVEIQNLWGRGVRYVGAYQSIAWFYAATTGQITIRHGMKGASSVIVAEGAGGLQALAHARRTIRRGVDVVVSGGLEAPLSPYALTCQLANGQMSTVEGPSAYRPFDADATGYLPGEGGAILLLEDLAAARSRGATRLYAEVAGYAATHDGGGPGAHQLERAMSTALADAALGPADVECIMADGAGSPEQDAREVEAIHRVFGARAGEVPVTAPKSMFGRLYAGGAALDVAAAALVIRTGRLPPTINLARPLDGLAFVTTPLSRPVRTVLVIARGYGGVNAALVLRAVD